MSPSRSLRNKDIPGLLSQFAEKYDLSCAQAQVVYDNMAWGFDWGRYEDTLVITSRPEHKNQLDMFRRGISKYIKVPGGITELSSGRYGFIIGR